MRRCLAPLLLRRETRAVRHRRTDSRPRLVLRENDPAFLIQLSSTEQCSFLNGPMGNCHAPHAVNNHLVKSAVNNHLVKSAVNNHLVKSVLLMCRAPYCRAPHAVNNHLVKSLLPARPRSSAGHRGTAPRAFLRTAESRGESAGGAIRSKCARRSDRPDPPSPLRDPEPRSRHVRALRPQGPTCARRGRRPRAKQKVSIAI